MFLPCFENIDEREAGIGESLIEQVLIIKHIVDTNNGKTTGQSPLEQVFGLRKTI